MKSRRSIFVILLIAVFALIGCFMLLYSSQTIVLDEIETVKFDKELIATQIIFEKSPKMITVTFWFPVVKGDQKSRFNIALNNSKITGGFWCPVEKKYRKFSTKKEFSSTSISTREESFPEWKKTTVVINLN